MNRRPPAFLFYVKDFLTSRKIAVMSLDQVGAYTLLMAACWDSDDCSLPDDDKTLSVLSRMGERWSTEDSAPVRACFVSHPKHPGHLTNERLLAEFKTLQQLRRDKRRAGHLGGVKSGLSRREQKGNTIEAELKQRFDSAASRTEAKRSSSISSSSSSSSSLPSSSSKERKEREENILLKTRVLRDEFEEFWLSYPRKVGKKAAMKSWEKAKDRPSLQVILAALEQQRQSEQWTKDGGKFIPHPATWLNEGRWLDQPMPLGNGAGCQNMVLRAGYPAPIKCLEPVYTPKPGEPRTERAFCVTCYGRFKKAHDERTQAAKQPTTMRVG